MPTPTSPMSWISESQKSKIAGFALARGGKVTFTILCIAPTAKMGSAILHRSGDEFLTALFWWSIITAWASLFWSSKRNRDMIATGVGEIKSDLPGETTPSADPAINRVQQKIEAGVPHGGTTA